MIRASSRPIATLPKDHKVCPRCGVIRKVNTTRKTTVCRDCTLALTVDERKVWAA